MLVCRDDGVQLRHLNVRNGPAHPGAACIRRLFHALGWAPEGIFTFSIVLSAVIVLLYIFLGGLTSAIYNEVLQFFLIIAGFLPLVLLGLKNIGGWSGLRTAVSAVDPRMMHEWKGVMHPSTNPMGIEIIGIGMGLGFVLGSGYWCTDFLVIQTAMASKQHGVRAPRSPHRRRSQDGVPVPGDSPGLTRDLALPTPHTTTTVARSRTASSSTTRTWSRHRSKRAAGLVPAKINPVTGKADARCQRPSAARLRHGHAEHAAALFSRPAFSGLGLTALLASFMSGMAGNVTAFNTVFTYDLYQSYIHKGAQRPALHGGGPMGHGRRHSAFDWHGISRRSSFNNIMDTLQLVFSFVNAPLFATFLLGMFWKRTTGHGAFAGLIAGTVAAMVHHGLTLPIEAHPGIHGGWITVVHHYPAIWRRTSGARSSPSAPTSSSLLMVSLFTKPRPESELVGLVHSLTPKPPRAHDQLVEEPRGAGHRGTAGRYRAEHFLCLRGRETMNLDLRIPMGLMFTFTGAILTVLGVSRPTATLTSMQRASAINANLWWGLVLLVFGLTMFLLGRRVHSGASRKNRHLRQRKAKCGEGIERQGRGTWE